MAQTLKRLLPLMVTLTEGLEFTLVLLGGCGSPTPVLTGTTNGLQGSGLVLYLFSSLLSIMPSLGCRVVDGLLAKMHIAITTHPMWPILKHSFILLTRPLRPWMLLGLCAVVTMAHRSTRSAGPLLSHWSPST